MRRLLVSIITVLTLSVLSVLPFTSDATVKLPVKFHRQEHSLSCEVATLKMALDMHGIVVSENQLIEQLAFDPTPKPNGMWGDPNKGFVGNINGRMLVDGYGVYWDPIAQLGNKYATTTVLQHSNAQELAKYINEGNPVIIWGYYGNRGVYNWQTPAGKTIKAVNGEHTRIVTGFEGTVDNPTKFYLIDPLSGEMSWSTEELMHNWSASNHMAVVVAPAQKWVRVPGETTVWEIDTIKKTRRAISTWTVFMSRGGNATAIKDITNQELLQYTVSSDITG